MQPPQPPGVPPHELAGTIYHTDGHALASYVKCFGTTCLHCHGLIGLSDEFFVLSPPYCGPLHGRCVSCYTFTGAWPHGFPIVGYRQS